jgi:hypothetical protein
MYERRLRNFPYMRCRVVFKKSLSLGSSESNSSRSCNCVSNGKARASAPTYIQDKTVINVGFGDVGIEVLTFNESEEKLIYHLDVGPSHFEHRFIFFRVKGLPLGIYRRRYGSEQILGEHVHYAGVHFVGDDLAVVCHIVQKLMQSEALDFLGLHIATGIVKVENNVALVDFLHEEVLALVRRYFVETRQLLQFSLTLV